MSDQLIRLLSLFIAFGAAALNVVLIPLVKSALRGEAREMIDDHNVDAEAHWHSKEAVSAASYRATDAAAAVARAETALADLRKDVTYRLDELAKQFAELHLAFVEHDAWERNRYAKSETPGLSKKKGKR